jgi:hypothetical protein
MLTEVTQSFGTPRFISSWEKCIESVPLLFAHCNLRTAGPPNWTQIVRYDLVKVFASYFLANLEKMYKREL